MARRAKRIPGRLKKRAGFLKAAKGLRASSDSVAVQATEPPDERAPLPRIGFTVTRALGGAVVRNRIRRRLKAAVASAEAIEWEPGRDYVLVARAAALRRPFDTLVGDVAGALKRLKKPRPKTPRARNETPET